MNNQLQLSVFNADFGRVSGVGGTQIEFDGVTAPVQFFPLELTTTVVGEFPALAGNLTINTGSGDDSVEVFGTSGPLSPFVIEGRLNVDLGAGADVFEQSISYVGANARIRGGSGAMPDSIRIEEAFFFGDTLIDTGDVGGGIDQITIDQGNFLDVELRGGSGITEVSFHDSVANGDLGIFTGNDDDQIFVSESFVFSDLRIDSGTSSHDPPGDYIQLGSSTIFEDLRISGRQGRQTIEFLPSAPGNDMDVGGDTLITTGPGRDIVRMHDDAPLTFHGNVRLRMGGGSDQVDVQDNVEFLGNLAISGGGGSDAVLFSSAVSVDGNGQLNGGSGNDLLTMTYEFATWLSGLPNVSSFEEII